MNYNQEILTAAGEAYEKVVNIANEAYKKIKIVMIILSIALIFLGIAVFFVPENVPAVAMWLMVIGLLIRGVFNIIIYIKLPKEIRDTRDLVFGIIWTLIAIFLIVGFNNASAETQIALWANFEMTLGFMVGFSTIFAGIDTLCYIPEIKLIGGSPALAVVSGVLGIIAGFVLLSHPISAALSLTIFYGLFLLISGIIHLTRALSY